MRVLLLIAAVLTTLPASAFAAEAIPTKVTVRAVSRDAKVIGDGVGGARITIRNLATGKILATGIQKGGTGDTKRIMNEPRTRGAAVYSTPGAAAFEATIPLTSPTPVEITAEGPLKYPQAMQRASKTLLLVPGADVTGDGVLLELHGYIVDLAENASAAKKGEPLHVLARVTMTCGCPTEPGGLWDANAIAITARVIRRGHTVAEKRMAYAGKQSTYATAFDPLPPGTYDIEVVASDAAGANFGRARRPITIAR